MKNKYFISTIILGLALTGCSKKAETQTAPLAQDGQKIEENRTDFYAGGNISEANDEFSKKFSELSTSVANKMANGDFTSSIDDINKLVEAYPARREVYYYRGSMLLGAGKPTEALVDLNKAIEMDEKHIDSYFVRANILQAKGDKAGAEADIKQAEALAKANNQLDPAMTERIERFREGLSK